MATPAEIANDMAAHADYWAGRDRKVEKLCNDANSLIRSLLDGEKIDGRRYHGVWRRLMDNERKYYDAKFQGWPNFARARSCIECLKQNGTPA